MLARSGGRYSLVQVRTALPWQVWIGGWRGPVPSRCSCSRATDWLALSQLEWCCPRSAPQSCHCSPCAAGAGGRGGAAERGPHLLHHRREPLQELRLLSALPATVWTSAQCCSQPCAFPSARGPAAGMCLPMRSNRLGVITPQPAIICPLPVFIAPAPARRINATPLCLGDSKAAVSCVECGRAGERSRQECPREGSSDAQEEREGQASIVGSPPSAHPCAAPGQATRCRLAAKAVRLPQKRSFRLRPVYLLSGLIFV